MQKTANQIKSEFELLASGHYQIHSFLYAQEFEQQAYENLIYPLMLVYPLGGNLSGTNYTRNYRVVIADRVLKSEGNELEVESDTQLIALDTLAYWMKLGTNERFSITSSNTITPFWEKWGDEVTGHFVDIGIEEFYDFNSCAVPLSSAIPSPTNPCKDARILINSVVYGNAPSDSNFNVVVKDQLGALVGSLIGGEWIVNTGGSCADATYTITNSTGITLYTGTIPSGGSLTQAISNSTLNVNNSASTLISSRSILAQGTDSYNVADSVAVIKDSLGTTLKSENILATASENITINNSSVNVNKSNGTLISAVSVKAENTASYNVADSTAVLKDEDGNTLSSTPIKATETTNITAPNGDVSVNSVAFDDVLSGGTLNIQVRKSTGNDLIGSKQGQYWRIGDSTITNSDSSYDVDVKATESLVLPDSQINVNSVDEGDVVSVKTIDVNLEDSLGAPVVPTSVGLVGNTLTIEVPSGASPSGVLFQFPHCSRYTSFRNGDEGWRLQNAWYDYTPPSYPATIAELDTSIGANFFYKLKNPLIVNGVSSTTRFVDVNGVQVFTSTRNANLVFIDKLTGLMYTRTDLDGTNTTWNNAIDGALSHSIVVNSITLDDWYLMANPECISTFGSFAEITGGWTDPINSTTIATYISAFHFTATTLSEETTYANSFRTMATASGLYYDIKTATRRRIFVRKCQDLITSP